MPDVPIDLAISADSATTADAVVAWVVSSDVLADSTVTAPAVAAYAGTSHMAAGASVAAPAVASYVVSSPVVAGASVVAPLRLHAVLASGIVGHASEVSGAHAAYKVSAHFIGVALMSPGTLDVDHHVKPKGPPTVVVPTVRTVQQQPPTVHPQILTGARRVIATPRTTPVRVKR